MGEDDVEVRIKPAILQYLADHPRAIDTVDGVRQWWIGSDLCLPPHERVAAALKRLVIDGVLERRAVPRGGSIYRARHWT